MSASYSVQVDVARSIVRITLSGFFGPDDIGGFLAQRKAAHARLKCPPNAHCTITDVRSMKIQSQDIVTAFQAMLAEPAYRSRRLAFVTAPTLARPQLLRAIGSRGAGVFDSDDAAEAWVLRPSDEAAVAA